MPDGRALGWDLGGAHLKVALAAPGDRVLQVSQIPCPLWLGMEKLRGALREARHMVDAGDGGARHGVTMTGELVDLFAGRAEGVARLVEAMTEEFPGADLRIYAGRSGFLAPAAAVARPDDVASANWLASAAFLAARLDEALFVDLGSTTTDLIPLSGGRPAVAGWTDAERLAAEELVYTGITRTPVMAVARTVPFAGARQALMAEYFATMADVHRLTGQLPADADLLPAADGGEKTELASARRLARMAGRDVESAELPAWRRLAGHLAERQLRQLHDAADRVLSRNGLGETAPLIGAGSGRFLLERLASRLDRPYRDFAAFVEGTAQGRDRAATCAPAVSVALLALDGW